MKFSITKLPKSQIKISVEIPTEVFNEYSKKAISELGKNIEVKGFRQGRAPKELVESKLDKSQILKTAGEIAVKENYGKIVSDNNLEVISKPEVTIFKLAPGNPFVFKCKIFVLPEIDLPDYKKIAPQIKRKEVSVTQKEIEDSLMFLQKSRAKFSALQRPAQEKDFVEIEYESPQIDSSKEIKDKFILGNGRFIPGFEEKLIGMKAGEEKEFSLPFPKNFFRKDLAGKKVDFKVRLVVVQKVEIPEINDEFVHSFGQFDDLASLKKSITEGLKMDKETRESQRVRNEILEKIAQKSKLEIPEILIEFEKDRLLADLKEKINQNLKISFENYLTSIKQSEKQLLDSFLKEAQKRVKNFLILREIGKKEKITVTEGEVKERVNKTLKSHSGTETEKIDIPELQEYTKGVIYNEKVLQKLESFSEKI